MKHVVKLDTQACQSVSSPIIPYPKRRTLLLVADYTVGEEVMYDEERYVVASISDDDPRRYRLLATSKKGAKFIWAGVEELEPMNSYLDPNDDTAKY